MRSDSAGTINSVDKVVVCGSRLLERYYEDDFTSSYIDAVEAVCSYDHDGHGIIPISLDGGDMKYLPFLQNSDLRLKSSANTADLRRLFFKLLQRIYTEEHALIGQFKECYENAHKRLQNEAGIAPPDFQVIIDQEISNAQNAWLQLQAAAIRDRGWEKELGRRTENHYESFRTLFSLEGMPVSNHFVDRPSDIADLEQCLLPQRHPHGQNRRRIFVLYGLGGIGKTQLAIHFARRYKDTFSSVFWLDGRSEDRLRQSIARCASRIPDDQIAERSRCQVLDSDNLDTVVTDVLAWLASPGNTDWLLVFDNVDQDHEQGGMTGAYDVRRYLPGDQGSILITSRLSHLAQLGDSKQLRKVDKDVAKAIFQTWYGGQLDTSSEELLSLLDGLPLALAQAASYLRETGIECSTYIDLYKNQWDDLIKFANISGSPLLDYERSIGTTWTISFKAIEAKSPYATNLLLLWAFLDNRELSYDLLQAAASGDAWPEWLRETAGNQVKFLDSVGILLRYSMIEFQENRKSIYTIHPVCRMKRLETTGFANGSFYHMRRGVFGGYENRVRLWTESILPKESSRFVGLEDSSLLKAS
ncbi:hypothetical protein DL768_008946 [Monosporascus sp. mg162]|nr:hypothetical protein DL768_008946 [Monosporascus sp. mg162]